MKAGTESHALDGLIQRLVSFPPGALTASSVQIGRGRDEGVAALVINPKVPAELPGFCRRDVNWLHGQTRTSKSHYSHVNPNLRQMLSDLVNNLPVAIFS